MALQLFKIAETTVATPQTSVEFSSIPSGYTDLKILASVRTVRSGSDTDYLELRFNNNSSASYQTRYIYGTGSTSASSSGGSGFTGTALGIDRFPSTNATSNTFGNFELYFPNYRSSSSKSFSVDCVTENNGTTAWQVMIAGGWSNTSAVTVLTFSIGGGTFIDAGSNFTLYGIL